MLSFSDFGFILKSEDKNGSENGNRVFVFVPKKNDHDD